MNRLRTRLAKAEVLLPAPARIVLSPDDQRLADFCDRHPRYPDLAAAMERVQREVPHDLDALINALMYDPQWQMAADEVTADFWRLEFAARALRGTPCHCRSFEHAACQPGARPDLDPHQRLAVDFALWFAPPGDDVISDRRKLLEQVGGQLNAECQRMEVDCVEGLGAAASSYGRPRLAPSALAWAVDSFGTFVAAGGARDIRAWLLALYAGEFRA